MEPVLAVVVGALFAASVYLVLRANLLELVIGTILMTTAVNLLIFAAGRLTRGTPPLVPEGAAVPEAPWANPLSQAMILTAIVIGFGMIVFMLTLAYRAHQETGEADPDAMEAALPPETDEPPG